MRSEEPLRFVVIGNPGNRRIEFFQAALQNLGMPPARVLPYRDLLAGSVDLPDDLEPGTFVRIESPGEDFEVEKWLLLAGEEAAAQEGRRLLNPPRSAGWNSIAA